MCLCVPLGGAGPVAGHSLSWDLESGSTLGRECQTTIIWNTVFVLHNEANAGLVQQKSPLFTTQ
jgi:hypothetical protein